MVHALCSHTECPASKHGLEERLKKVLHLASQHAVKAGDIDAAGQYLTARPTFSIGILCQNQPISCALKHFVSETIALFQPKHEEENMDIASKF